MSYTTEAARHEFDRWSRRYDWDPLQLLFFRPAHRMLLNQLSSFDRRVLDVGCGTGVFAAAVLRQFPHSEVWGIDLSQGMLSRCPVNDPELAGRLHCVRGDSAHLPFADGSFDAVTCSHSFHHYPHQEEVLAEMHRVLRTGGRLLLIDGDRDRLWGWLVFEVAVVQVEGDVHHQTSAALREMYAQQGFINVWQQRRGGPLPFLMTVGEAGQVPSTRRRAA